MDVLHTSEKYRIMGVSYPHSSCKVKQGKYTAHWMKTWKEQMHGQFK